LAQLADWLSGDWPASETLKVEAKLRAFIDLADGQAKPQHSAG
jgi:hypothetical protein